MNVVLRGALGAGSLYLVMGLAVFLTAGTAAWWQGWAMLAVFIGSASMITVWLWFHDKALLERRVTAGPGTESDPGQNVVQALAGVIFLAALVLPGLDHRFGWSRVPVAVEIAGDILIAVGFWVVFLVFRANSFAAGTIVIAEDQKVIDTGPYALVRHPMYSGALLMFVGMPLGLGSWWGLLSAAAIVPVLGWRLMNEEQFLVEHLEGYDAYRQRITHRLLPGVW